MNASATAAAAAQPSRTIAEITGFTFEEGKANRRDRL